MSSSRSLDYPDASRGSLSELYPDESGDLEIAIAKGVKFNRFGDASAVGLHEASAKSTEWYPSLDDKELARNLECVTQGLAITPSMLLQICSMFKVTALFVDAILEYLYFTKPGNGLFLRRADDGRPSSLIWFYRYSYGLKSGRAYIFTRYDFINHVTTNICVHFVPEGQSRWIEKTGARIGRSSSQQPLALHAVLFSYTLNCWNADGNEARMTLLREERSQDDTGPKAIALNLHKSAQNLHIILEDLKELEMKILLLINVSKKLCEASTTTEQSIKIEDETQLFEYLLSKCIHSKSWISSYRDGTNLRINLAFYSSTQVDNKLSLRISEATTTIAHDAQRDSSSMITIAAVTMFFLPGTFISAIFSMSFFNFQPDDGSGVQQFRVSDKLWYFLAATIPLTCIVFAIWIAWQRFRFRSHQKDLAKDINTKSEEATKGEEIANWKRSFELKRFWKRKGAEKFEMNLFRRRRAGDRQAVVNERVEPVV